MNAHKAAKVSEDMTRLWDRIGPMVVDKYDRQDMADLIKQVEDLARCRKCGCPLLCPDCEEDNP